MFSSLATRTSVQSFSIANMARIMTMLCQRSGDSKCRPNLGRHHTSQGAPHQGPPANLEQPGASHSQVAHHGHSGTELEADGPSDSRPGLRRDHSGSEKPLQEEAWCPDGGRGSRGTTQPRAR